jgi:hypothetical protein
VVAISGTYAQPLPVFRATPRVSSGIQPAPAATFETGSQRFQFGGVLGKRPVVSPKDVVLTSVRRLEEPPCGNLTYSPGWNTP